MVQEKRRRRKRVRIEDQSSSDSDSGSESSASVEQQEQIDQDEHEDSSESETESHPENSRLLAHKKPAFEGDFNQKFLEMVTTEFGNDLENLRKAPDFKEGSLDLLISGLKQGVNIFDQEQKRLLLTK